MTLARYTRLTLIEINLVNKCKKYECTDGKTTNALIEWDDLPIGTSTTDLGQCVNYERCFTSSREIEWRKRHLVSSNWVGDVRCANDTNAMPLSMPNWYRLKAISVCCAIFGQMLSIYTYLLNQNSTRFVRIRTEYLTNGSHIDVKC